jgi:hypothetical protein
VDRTSIEDAQPAAVPEGDAATGRPPFEFLVVGAQKCATSWLYYCLRDHPALQLPEVKREVEYIGGALWEERGAAWYFGLVEARGPEQRAGDVSVEYLFDPRSAPIVARLLPNVRLVASLRHPVERAVSAYYWLLRKRRIPDITLVEALETALEDTRAGRNTAYAELLARGRYAEQLQRWLEHFPADQLLVVAYDDVARRPLDVLARVYGFLGVEHGFRPKSLESRPKHNTFLRPLVALERLAPRTRAASRLSDALNNLARRAGLAGKKESVPAELHRRLQRHFEPDLERLVALVRQTGTAQASATADVIAGWRRGSTSP